MSLAVEHGIYVASRVKHADVWRAFRSAWPIVASWIYEADPGEPLSMSDLWLKCVAEASQAKATVLYVEGPADLPLKGALVEAGAALAWQRPVFVVGSEHLAGSWVAHPLVRPSISIETALRAAKAVRAGLE